MCWIDKIRGEIVEYKNLLKDFNAIDFTRAWTIINEADREEQKYYNETVKPLEEEYEVTCDALNKIANFNKLVRCIKQTEDEKKIKERYQSILEIRRAVKKAFPNGISIEEGENEVDFVRKVLKNRKEELSKRQIVNYNDLADYMVEENRDIVKELAKALSSIAVYKGGDLSKKFPNLVQLLTITTLRVDCAECCPDFGKEYSVVFREEIDNLLFKLSFNYTYDKCLDEKIFQIISNDYTLNEGNNFIAFIEQKRKDIGFVFVREKFLNDLLKIIDENKDFDLFYLSDYLRKEYCAKINKENEDIIDTIEELARLYRETPAQILITEQRYYQQKQIAQLRENARREREMIELQAQKEREEFAYQQEQNRRQIEKNRASREIAEREEIFKLKMAEEKSRREKSFQQMLDRADNFRKTMKEQSDRNKAMHLCWRCANLGNGCDGGILGCGNFRSKK